MNNFSQQKVLTYKYGGSDKSSLLKSTSNCVGPYGSEWLHMTTYISTLKINKEPER